MYQEAGALLQRLGLPLDPRTKARELSVAQQQVVEIARALSINARVLIMDEPTSSLTLREVEDLFAIVRQLRAAGTAIVFISHRLEELFALADRVTILRDGAYVGTRADDRRDHRRADPHDGGPHAGRAVPQAGGRARATWCWRSRGWA